MVLIDKKDFALKMLAEFQKHIGEGRFNDQEYITRILAVSGLPFEENGIPIAFCDPYLTFLACKILAELNGAVLTETNAVEILKTYRAAVDANYFVTESSVAITVEKAKARGQFLDAKEIGEDTDILPAWLICYDWGSGEHHIGMTVEDEGDILHTIEANTSSQGHTGMIAKKSRDWDFVWGFVKLY